MRVEDFDYELPQRLIAQTPAEPRDASRLMVLHRDSGAIEHRVFRDVCDYLRPGDVLVVNNTRVMPARLYGHKDTGARIEIMLLERLDGDVWKALVKPGKRVREGAEIGFPGTAMRARCLGIEEQSGARILRFSYEGVFEEILDRIGIMPLPPYITEQLKEQERYQTVYSKHKGSAAAPTAGLHFTPHLLQKIRAKGVEIREVLLHVGLGTFRPVQTERVEDHAMHAEYYEVSEETAQALRKAKEEGRRIIAVGTTSVRTLESLLQDCGEFRARRAETNIFIYPGIGLKAIDGMITNFHLPKSTLIMLVSAFAGTELTMQAYHEAVAREYRFFSFGDAMLID